METVRAPAAPATSRPRTVEAIFRDFSARRAGLVRALTSDVDDFFDSCDPDKENLCLYGHPDGSWEVSLPAEEVPPELPEPALGINFARNGMNRRDWLSLVAVHSDSWLLSVAFFFGAPLSANERKRLFSMINDLPNVYESMVERKHRDRSGVDSGGKSRHSSKPKQRTDDVRPKNSRAVAREEDDDEDEPLPPVGHGDGGLGDWFARILDVELHKLNDFYMEREEWYVIRLQVLKERIERVKAKKNGAFTSKTEFTEEMLEIRRDFVLIHGEMILLQTYSSLNFAGLVKILKKYDKRTGGVLSLPFTQRARHQPFFTTEPLTRLVRECEANLEILFPVEDEVLESGSSSKLQAHNDSASRDPASSCDAETSEVYRSTLAAMKAIEGLKKASSTYNALSLARFFHGEDGEACSGAITSESSLSDSMTDSQVEDADKDDKEVQSKEQNSAQIDHNAEAERRGG